MLWPLQVFDAARWRQHRSVLRYYRHMTSETPKLNTAVSWSLQLLLTDSAGTSRLSHTEGASKAASTCASLSSCSTPATKLQMEGTAPSTASQVAQTQQNIVRSSPPELTYSRNAASCMQPVRQPHLPPSTQLLLIILSSP